MSEFANRSSRGLSVEEVEFEGNTSGFEAYDYKVFVLKDKVKDTTDGGIVIARDLADQEEWTVVTGVLVSAGHLAFTEGRDSNGELIYWDRRPQVGDRVMVQEFAGQKFKGKDEKFYLIFNDKQIIGGKQ